MRRPRQVPSAPTQADTTARQPGAAAAPDGKRELAALRVRPKEQGFRREQLAVYNESIVGSGVFSNVYRAELSAKSADGRAWSRPMQVALKKSWPPRAEQHLDSDREVLYPIISHCATT